MRRRAAALPVVAVLLLAGCGAGPSAAGPSAASSASSSAAPLTITVFAAASLRTSFTELGAAFEARHPGTTVAFSFAGSSDLVSQIVAGAPADVFASADEANMAKVLEQELIAGRAVDFATNVLEIATPPGNPARVASFADLARPGLDVVVCAPQVPCGAAAVKAEAATGTTLTPVSEESSVTDVLGKVTSGEADAGLVYATDVRAAGAAVTGVPFPESAGAVNTYPIAALSNSEHAADAAAFRDFVTSADGRAVLAAAGFGEPPA
ncbi:molybdate ABC transporter substrate-binding protein [Kineococcus rubinsiae]|uniref:molybdate ABC transporter substrate-binding protein n=1 Tax=Kineococcus rubinsiae TaxID=2609562 RepID=UPI0014315251|nr:molybdate ABC transporter substrate-binding protein [Kineococcus rubinsiae]NIZ91792.1 molybdate ABC transporter substrate-binding protein [Kineococcus rubinsiae]